VKRSILDITQKISRKINLVSLTPNDLSDNLYWIWEARGWRFVEILREIEYRNNQDRISVMINTQNVSNRDFIVEEKGGNILVKFVKDRFEYQLDEFDYIEIKGDIEKYA
jgi:hypothetical protein